MTTAQLEAVISGWRCGSGGTGCSTKCTNNSPYILTYEGVGEDPYQGYVSVPNLSYILPGGYICTSIDSGGPLGFNYGSGQWESRYLTGISFGGQSYSSLPSVTTPTAAEVQAAAQGWTMNSTYGCMYDGFPVGYGLFYNNSPYTLVYSYNAALNSYGTGQQFLAINDYTYILPGGYLTADCTSTVTDPTYAPYSGGYQLTGVLK